MNIAQLPVDFVIYVIQVSQLLMAVGGGCVNKWKGKQLADISVEGIIILMPPDRKIGGKLFLACLSVIHSFIVCVPKL